MNTIVKYRKTKYPWLGDIPENWKLVKVRTLFNIGRGRVIAATEIGVSI